jgi:hypothetical protein
LQKTLSLSLTPSAKYKNVVYAHISGTPILPIIAILAGLVTPFKETGICKTDKNACVFYPATVRGKYF